MSATKADFVAIAHADDLSFPDRLKLQVEALQRRPDASAVAALSRHVDRKNRIIQPTGYWRLFRHSPFAPFAHSSLMVRRSLFEKVGGYREEANYWEDLDLYWRLIDVGPILVLPEVLTSYRHSDVSIRSRDEAQYVEDALDLMYRCAALHSAGLNHSELLMSGRSPETRINPRIFIARSWTSVWQNRRPGTVRRFLQRGDIHFDRRSLGSLAFVLAGTLSPRLVALSVQGWMRALDAKARLRMRARGLEPFEWVSRDSDAKPVTSLTDVADRARNDPSLRNLESSRSVG
jgi:hypothetical protein